MSETPKLSAEAELMLLFVRSDDAEKVRMYRDCVATAQGLGHNLESRDDEITKLKSQLEEARARVNELATGFSTGLAEIKDELNGLALMGAVPMWGSLIGRLDDLAVEVLNGGGKR